MQNGYRVAVLTASDKGAAGQRVDESGPLVAARATEAGFAVAAQALLPDDRPALERQLLAWCQSGQIDLVLTTGGTGLAPRDCMPEATMAVCTRPVPGIAEAMRAHSMAITPRGMLSRAAAGICQRTLIVNLPGSPKAVDENLDAILPSLPHALDMLSEARGECAQNQKD